MKRQGAMGSLVFFNVQEIMVVIVLCKTVISIYMKAIDHNFSRQVSGCMGEQCSEAERPA